MQSDEDIGRMIASVPVAIGSAMEHFAEKLLESAAQCVQVTPFTYLLIIIDFVNLRFRLLELSHLLTCKFTFFSNLSSFVYLLLDVMQFLKIATSLFWKS